MGLLPFRYLHQEHLTGFDQYKYCSVDNSPLSTYVTHPFWEKCVQICPRWLAPNLMTFVGFLLLVANFFILSFYDLHFLASSVPETPDPHLPPSMVASHIPRWVWLFCAFGQFVAHTLDGCDGKQARRTGSSTPLGELFDHGLDAWSCLFLPLALYSVFGRSEVYSVSPLSFYFIVYVICFQFFLSHWEKYNTGVLFLPWAYDFSQLLLVVLYLLTFIFDVEIWQHKFPLVGVSVGHVSATLFYMTTFAFALPTSLWNTYVAYRDKTGKGHSFVAANAPWVPFALLFALTTLWAVNSPNNIIQLYPRLFFYMCGTIFANITCRLIIAQMSSTPAPWFNDLLVPVIMCDVMLSFRLLSSSFCESLFLLLVCVCVTISHVHFGVTVVKEMAEHFNIYVFSLKKKEFSKSTSEVQKQSPLNKSEKTEGRTEN